MRRLTEPPAGDLEPFGSAERLGDMYVSAAVEAAGTTTDGGAALADPDSSAVFGFEAFYRQARPTIARALALALGDADVAADATDEAMTRAYERWATVGKLDHPEAWVYRVATNWAMSIFRRRRLGLHRLYSPTSLDASPSDPAVHDAVAALDIKFRSVVVCRHLLGWSVAETAEALGTTEGTVKSRLHRAHLALRTRLQHLNASEEQS